MLVVVSCDQPHEGDELVTEDVVTVEFGYEGKVYSTELCPEHLNEYHTWMRDYLEHGARLSERSARRPKAKTKAMQGRHEDGAEDLAALRAWANENGFAIGRRGRISTAIKEAYAAAH